MSLIDYPGQVATVVFTMGCNFRCRYCHNAKLVVQKCQSIDLKEWWSWLETRQGKLDAVVVSGGEPTLQLDLAEFIFQIKRRGFKVKLDTNGTNPDMVRDLIDRSLVDYIAMDIKAPLEKYHEITGINYDTEKIKQSIRLIIDSKIDHEFRTTYVDGLLEISDLKEIVGLIKGAKRYYVQDFVYSDAVLDKSLVMKSGLGNDKGSWLNQGLMEIGWR